MSAKKPKGPSKINSGGENYRLCLFKIIDRDHLGRPKTVVLGYDDTEFKLDGGEEFVTCYVHEKSIRKADA